MNALSALLSGAPSVNPFLNAVPGQGSHSQLASHPEATQGSMDVQAVYGEAAPVDEGLKSIAKLIVGVPTAISSAGHTWVNYDHYEIANPTFDDHTNPW